MGRRVRRSASPAITVIASLALLATLAPVTEQAEAGIGRDCRERCVATIASCAAAELTPLVDQGVTGTEMKRTGRRTRRRCKRQVLRRCRREGVEACSVSGPCTDCPP